MAFFPECFAFMGSSASEVVQQSTTLDSELFRRYRSVAAENSMWLSLGGFHERGPAGKVYNTHVVLDDQGEIRASYRKIHLFDVDVPNGPVLMESSTTMPGDRLVVVDSPVGRLGLSICYDLRFPEVYSKLHFDLGAQILTVPSAFTKITGQAHWEILLRARAIETQSYVIAAAQAGAHNSKRESWGHSLIIDPWGEVIGRLEDGTRTGIAVASIDLNHIAEINAKMPIDLHRFRGRKALEEASMH